jgi:AAA family ATP:ADP antiporter
VTAERLSVRIHRDEWPLVVLMFLYFFGVITTFWILKPIKKGLFVGFYSQLGESFELLGWQMSGPQAELIAKIGNLLVVFAAVVVFTWLARSLRREQLTYVFGAFTLLILVLYMFLLPVAG